MLVTVLLASVAVSAFATVLVAAWYQRNRWAFSQRFGGHRIPEVFSSDTLVEFQTNKASDTGTSPAGRAPALVQWDGPTAVLRVTHPTVAGNIFDGGHMHPRPYAAGLGDFLGRFLGVCMGCLHGDDWKRVRGCFRPFLMQDFVNKHANIVTRLSNLRVQQLHDAMLDRHAAATTPTDSSSRQPSVTMSLQDVVGTFPLDVVLEFFFGRRFLEEQQDKVAELRRCASTLLTTCLTNKAASFRLYRFLPTQANRNLAAFQRLWAEFLCSYQRSSDFGQPEGGAYAHLAQSKTMSDDERSQTMAEIVFANQDVSIPVMCFQLAHLAVYPELQASLARDLRLMPSNVESLDAIPKPLANFINESSRVSPPTPFSMREFLGHPVQVGEDGGEDGGPVVVPAGTPFCIDTFAINNNAQAWENPDKFNPDRFNDDIPKFAFFNTGLNPKRQCPGQHLARLMMSTFLNNILQHFVIDIADGRDDDDDDDHDNDNDGMDAMSSAATPMRSHLDVPCQEGFGLRSPELRVRLRPRVHPTEVQCDAARQLREGTVFVGISVYPTSPNLDPSNVVQLLRYCALLPRPTLFVLGDALARHNELAFGKPRTMELARTKALEFGDKFVEAFKTARNALSNEEQSKILFARWEDMCRASPGFDTQLVAVRDQYNSNPYFQERVDALALEFARVRKHDPTIQATDKKFLKRKEHLVDYILEEIPFVVGGPSHAGTHFNTFLYPSSSHHIATMVSTSGRLKRATVAGLMHDIHCHPDLESVRVALKQQHASFAKDVIVPLPLDTL